MSNDTEMLGITGFQILDLNDQANTGINGQEAKFLVTFDKVVQDTTHWRTLQDCLLGYFDYQRNATDNSINKTETDIPIIEQKGYYDVDLNNTSFWQELSTYEKDIARRLFGIYVPRTIEGNTVQVYTGSFLDEKAIQVKKDTPIQDIYGNWYFEPDLDDQGKIQYITEGQGDEKRTLTAIEAFYTTPKYLMKKFKTDGDDKEYWYPVPSDTTNAVTQEFAEYLYKSLNTSSFVQDLLVYSRFWSTLASEDWELPNTLAVMSKTDIDNLFDERYVKIANGELEPGSEIIETLEEETNGGTIA